MGKWVRILASVLIQLQCRFFSPWEKSLRDRVYPLWLGLCFILNKNRGQRYRYAHRHRELLGAMVCDVGGQED